MAFVPVTQYNWQGFGDVLARYVRNEIIDIVQQAQNQAQRYIQEQTEKLLAEVEVKAKEFHTEKGLHELVIRVEHITTSYQ